MSVRLIYLQGNIRKEERASSIAAAVELAVRLMDNPNCYRDFEIRDGFGRVLLDKDAFRTEQERKRDLARQQEIAATRALSARRVPKQHRLT